MKTFLMSLSLAALLGSFALQASAVPLPPAGPVIAHGGQDEPQPGDDNGVDHALPASGSVVAKGDCDPDDDCGVDPQPHA